MNVEARTAVAVPPDMPIMVVAGSFLLQAGLLATAVLATNPDYNFPGVVELLLIGISLLCIACSLRQCGVWEKGDGLACAALGCLWALAAVRYALAWSDPGNAQGTACLALPGVVEKTECLLQLPFWTNYGLRQLLMHLTAFSVFWAAAALGRIAGSQAVALAPVFLLTPLLFAVAALGPKFVPGLQTLAGWNLVQNEIGGTARGAGLTSNPGWLWPLLAAPGALAAGLLASRSTGRALTGALVLGVILVAVGDAGQRGGYLLLFLLLACAGIYLGAWRTRALVSSRGRRTLVSLGLMAAAMAVIVAAARPLGALLAWLGRFELFAGFGAQHLVLSSSARAVMWRCAWDQSLPVFWTGHGYASWLRVAAAACPGERTILDSGHNLWLQMLFELGAIHALLITAVMVWLLFRVVARTTRRPLEIEAGILAVIPVFLLVAAVQEIDYIPATYYQFASIGGYLWGSSSSLARVGASALAPTRSRRAVPVVLVVAAIGCLAGSAVYARSISWGGYTYAPVDVPGFRFSRWFRPEGAIAATSDGSAHRYSVFPFAELPPESPRLTPDPDDALASAVTTTGITAANGSNGWPRQFRYSSDVRIAKLSRLNAFSVLLPPLQTNLLLLAETGTSPWEVSGDGLPEKWCRRRCSIEFAGPPNKTGRYGLRVYVEQPCVSQLQPVRFHYVLDARPRGAAGFIPAATGTLEFVQPRVPQDVHFPSMSTWPDRWRLALETVAGCPEPIPQRGRSGPEYSGARVLLDW